MFSRIVVVLSNLPESQRALLTAIDLDQFVRVLDIQGGIFAISGDGANQLSTATGLRRAMYRGSSNVASRVGGQRRCAVLHDLCV